MAGFGREPFGHHPFGKSDFGKDTVSRVFPRTTLELDTNNELLHYLYTIENSANNRRAEIDSMVELIDPDKVRQDILFSLGKMIGIDLDANEGEEFQRTLVRDAVQYYQLKGTNKSFTIRGKISGFDVEVIKIWKIDPVYLPYLPPRDRLEFPPGSGTVSGIWYTDLEPQNVEGVSGIVPITGDCTYCLTSYVKVKYTLIKQSTGSSVGNILDRVVQKIKDVIPIHVRDIFIDLTVNFCTEANSASCMLINESMKFTTFLVDRYDSIPADCVMLDLHIPSVKNGD